MKRNPGLGIPRSRSFPDCASHYRGLARAPKRQSLFQIGLCWGQLWMFCFLRGGCFDEQPFRVFSFILFFFLVTRRHFSRHSGLPPHWAGVGGPDPPSAGGSTIAKSPPQPGGPARDRGLGRPERRPVWESTKGRQERNEDAQKARWEKIPTRDVAGDFSVGAAVPRHGWRQESSKKKPGMAGGFFLSPDGRSGTSKANYDPSVIGRRRRDWPLMADQGPGDRRCLGVQGAALRNSQTTNKTEIK